jgi:hypothetical protein
MNIKATKNNNANDASIVDCCSRSPSSAFVFTAEEDRISLRATKSQGTATPKEENFKKPRKAQRQAIIISDDEEEPRNTRSNYQEVDNPKTLKKLNITPPDLSSSRRQQRVNRFLPGAKGKETPEGLISSTVQVSTRGDPAAQNSPHVTPDRKRRHITRNDQDAPEPRQCKRARTGVSDSASPSRPREHESSQAEAIIIHDSLPLSPITHRAEIREVKKPVSIRQQRKKPGKTTSKPPMEKANDTVKPRLQRKATVQVPVEDNSPLIGKKGGLKLCLNIVPEKKNSSLPVSLLACVRTFVHNNCSFLSKVPWKTFHPSWLVRTKLLLA